MRKEEVKLGIDPNLGLALPLTEGVTSVRKGEAEKAALFFLPSLKADGKMPITEACCPCFKWLDINIPINKINNGETCQEKVLEGAASRQLRLPYHLHHLGNLANSHPELMPVQTAQLLLQISHHQQEENPLGRGFILDLGIACHM